MDGRNARRLPRLRLGAVAEAEEYRNLVDWREGDNTLVFALDTRDGAIMTGVHVSIPDR